MPVDRQTSSKTPRPDMGIVHRVLGAFHLAYDGAYVAAPRQASGGDWGVIGVPLQSLGTCDARAPQD